MKRLLLFAVFAIAGSSSFGQGLAPQPIPCLEPYIYTHPTSPGAYSVQRKFAHVSCIDLDYPTPTPGQLISEGATEVVAGESVHLGSNVHVGLSGAPPVNIGGGATIAPYFHMHVTPNDFDVMWYEPNSSPGEVGQYEKLELGLRLPSDLQQKINRFVGDSTSGTKINPFDPEQISVEADMYYLADKYNILGASYQKTIYGFYYKEFIRNASDDSVLTNDTWITDTTSFNFRIRFAPPTLGNWAAQIRIVTPGGTTYAWPVMFKCVGSDNPGFVKVGANNRFLQLGDQTFIPIGTNMPAPTCIDCDSLGIPGELGGEAYASHTMRSLGYERYHEQLENLRDNGANYFRMLIAPWATDIEFEHVGNYSDRMNGAWEMDEILEKIKDIGLYMHLDMQFHYTLENPTYYQMWYWDWGAMGMETYDSAHQVYPTELWHYSEPDSGYAYHYELGLEDPLDFFTDSVAMYHYKNKLRYMFARWGYSTNIAVWEMYSEIDNPGSAVGMQVVWSPSEGKYVFSPIALPRPYWINNYIAEDIGEWQIEMARYIKEDLNHTDHLIGVDYTGTRGSAGFERTNSDYWGADITYDPSYNSEYIDIMGINMYKGGLIDRFRGLANDQASYRYTQHNKPLMLPEIGAAINDSSNVPRGPQTCSGQTEFIRELWCSTFSGTASPGLDYKAETYDVDGTWHNYGILSDFLEGNTFAFDNWEPFHDERGDHLAECFALVNNTTGDEATGVVVNKTYNYYTQGGTNTICFLATNRPDPEYENAVNVSPDIFQQLKLDLANGVYSIDWYDVLTGDQVFPSSVGTVSPLTLGKLSLEYPTLYTHSSSFFHPILAFKVKPFGTKSLITSNEHRDSLEVSSAEFDFNCYPNPTSRSATIQTVQQGVNEVKVINTAGKVMLSQTMSGTTLEIDTHNWEEGIYFVTLTNKLGTYAKKLIVLHYKND